MAISIQNAHFETICLSSPAVNTFLILHTRPLESVITKDGTVEMRQELPSVDNKNNERGTREFRCPFHCELMRFHHFSVPFVSFVNPALTQTKSNVRRCSGLFSTGSPFCTSHSLLTPLITINSQISLPRGNECHINVKKRRNPERT